MRKTELMTRRRGRDLQLREEQDLLPQEVEETLAWATPRRLMRVADGRLEMPDLHPALRELLEAALEDVLDYERRGHDRQHSYERLRSHLLHFRSVLAQDWVQEGLQQEPYLVCRLLEQLVVQHPAYDDDGVICVSDPFYRTTRRSKRRT